MTSIVAISGSLRTASINGGLMRAATTRMPAGATLDIRSIADVPLYDEDVETSAFPAAVAALKDSIAAADGLLLFSPEYNNSVPGVLKNAIDWCSRPTDDIGRVFAGRKVGLVGATPGAWGTILGQNAWLPVFRTLRAEVWSGQRLIIPNAGSSFDKATGDLVDYKAGERLASYLKGFVEWVSAGG